MDRGDFVKEVMDSSSELVVTGERYRQWLLDVVLAPIIADVGGRDLTGHAVLSSNKTARAAIVARSDLLLAGIEEAEFLLSHFHVTCNIKRKDGDRVRKGTTLVEVSGREQDIVKAERGILEVITRMSAIATRTAKLVKGVQERVFLAPTRKSLFPLLDKKAASIAGCVTHRLGLFDAVLIKDNHLAQVKLEAVAYVQTALERSWKAKGKFVEIEVSNENEALDAATAFSSLRDERGKGKVIMFDNMDVASITHALDEIRGISGRNQIIFEASGGINAGNVLSYAETGVDVISMGQITRDLPQIDISLEMIP